MIHLACVTLLLWCKVLVLRCVVLVLEEGPVYITGMMCCRRYNRLTSVPESLSNCVNMDEFNVEGNNISQLPVCYLLITLSVSSIISCTLRWCGFVISASITLIISYTSLIFSWDVGRISDVYCSYFKLWDISMRSLKLITIKGHFKIATLTYHILLPLFFSRSVTELV